MKKRIHCIFKGRVQGVGFRYTAQSLALKHNIKGWVRNNPDGTVELVAEEEAENLELFFRELVEYFKGYISDYVQKVLPYEDEFSDFRIRFY